jgi:hypothetical protein
MNEWQKKTYLIHTIISIVVLIIAVCLIIFIIKFIESINDPKGIFILPGLIFGIYAMYLIVSTVRVLAICKRPPIINTIATTIILIFFVYNSSITGFCYKNVHTNQLLTIEHIETAMRHILDKQCLFYKKASNNTICPITFDTLKQANPNCFEQGKIKTGACYGRGTYIHTEKGFEIYNSEDSKNTDIYIISRNRGVVKNILGYIQAKAYFTISSKVGGVVHGVEYKDYDIEVPCKL